MKEGICRNADLRLLNFIYGKRFHEMNTSKQRCILLCCDVM